MQADSNTVTIAILMLLLCCHANIENFDRIVCLLAMAQDSMNATTTPC